MANLWIREGIFSNKHLAYTYKIIISSIFGGLKGFWLGGLCGQNIDIY
jgi:hypothetical protein